MTILSYAEVLPGNGLVKMSDLAEWLNMDQKCLQQAFDHYDIYVFYVDRRRFLGIVSLDNIRAGFETLSTNGVFGKCSRYAWHDWNKSIYINAPFKGCHRHHMTTTIVVCIPSELHEHIHHNLKTGENMGEMNAIAIQYINGGLSTKHGDN